MPLTFAILRIKKNVITQINVHHSRGDEEILNANLELGDIDFGMWSLFK